MVSLHDSLISTSSRPLLLKRRADVTATRQQYHGRYFWILKDPVGLNYFRFHEEEYALWNMLDGTTSLDDMKEEFDRRFAPERITLAELHQFVGMLHKSGLVQSTMSGQGTQLYQREREKNWQKLKATFSNILAVRFRGIDPERLLTWLYPKCRWFFSRWCVALSLFLGLTALMLITVHFDTFRAKLPDFQNFFTIENMFWLWIVLGVTKVIHEFGHGLSCKHFGGECHEMGVMFLVLTPCLYCNVSDSWMLPNKWHRMAIGAAGMYVELVMASIATFIWWFTEPGLLHHLALNVMFICSVSTILFNGNPLLRYDGYYILADYLEIPNLQQKSRQILTRQLGWLCLGLEKPVDPFLPQQRQWAFALYAVASTVYRWFVLFSILFFLNKFFEPYRLKVIGQAIALTAILSLIGIPIYKVIKFFWVPGRIHQVKPLRFVATLAVLCGVILAIAYVPFSHHIQTTFVVQPRDAAHVFVQTPGKLAEVYVKPGQWVEEGQKLARLEDFPALMRIEQLKSRRDEQRARLESAYQQRLHDKAVGAQILEAKQALANLQEQLVKRQEEIDRLTLKAPRSGYVLAPPRSPKQPSADATLASWSGSPFELRNRGSYLETGTLFCRVGDPHELEAVMVIDQSDVEFVQPGQKVRMQFDQSSGATTPGVIEEVAKQDLKIAPKSLSGKAGGRLATETDESGRERPLSASYQARVPLDDASALRPGVRGRAKIHVGSRSWGGWLARYVSETFHFRL